MILFSLLQLSRLCFFAPNFAWSYMHETYYVTQIVVCVYFLARVTYIVWKSVSFHLFVWLCGFLNTFPSNVGVFLSFLIFSYAESAFFLNKLNTSNELLPKKWNDRFLTKLSIRQHSSQHQKMLVSNHGFLSKYSQSTEKKTLRSFPPRRNPSQFHGLADMKLSICFSPVLRNYILASLSFFFLYPLKNRFYFAWA